VCGNRAEVQYRRIGGGRASGGATAAPRRQHLRATIFDTADEDLARAASRCECGRCARRVQTLKARGAHAGALDATLRRAPAPAVPLPARHAGSPALQAAATSPTDVEDFDASR
jgi:hypothetical protein